MTTETVMSEEARKAEVRKIIEGMPPRIGTLLSTVLASTPEAERDLVDGRVSAAFAKLSEAAEAGHVRIRGVNFEQFLAVARDALPSEYKYDVED
jgi:hypothetical protein